jgi:hypothetical protein
VVTLIRSHQRRADAATTTTTVKALSGVVRGEVVRSGSCDGSGEAEGRHADMAHTGHTACFNDVYGLVLHVANG